MKVKNFFFATIIGIIPQVFLVVSVGSGLEKVIDKNLEAPSAKDLIYTSDIYIPIVAFVTLILITIIARKIFYKN